MRKGTLISVAAIVLLALFAAVVLLVLSGSPSQSDAADTLAGRMKASQELAGDDNPAKVSDAADNLPDRMKAAQDLAGDDNRAKVSDAADTLADRMKAAQELAGGDNPAKVMALLGDGITNFKAFMFLNGLAQPFILGPNGEFHGTRNKRAFAAAISNITPAALDRTKKLIGTPDSALAFGVLLNSSSRFVLKPNAFSSTAFNTAFQHMTEATVQQTIRVVGADSINAEKSLTLLLAGSARFVGTEGRFDADAFDKTLASITSQTVTIDAKGGGRAEAFDALLRPSSPQGKASSQPAETAVASLEWKTFTSRIGRFSIDMPGTPEEEEEAVVLKGDRAPKHWDICGVTYRELQQSEKDLSTEHILNNCRKERFRQLGIPGRKARLLSRKEIMLGGYPGREFVVIRRPTLGSPPVVFRERIYLARPRVYRVYVGSELGPPRGSRMGPPRNSRMAPPRNARMGNPREAPEDVNRFLSSFRLYNGDALKEEETPDVSAPKDVVRSHSKEKGPATTAAHDGKTSEYRIDSELLGKTVGYAGANGVKEHVMKLGLANTNFQAFTMLIHVARFFVLNDEGKLNPHATEDAFVTAVHNVTPEMLKRGRELIAAGNRGDANTLAFFAFISTSDDFLRFEGEFAAKAFNSAFSNLKTEMIEKAASLMKTTKAVSLCHLLTASGNFVQPNGEFNATQFNARLSVVLATEITGSENERIGQFLAALRPDPSRGARPKGHALKKEETPDESAPKDFVREPAKPLIVDEAANGRTVTAVVGQEIYVRLSERYDVMNYWTADDPDQDILQKLENIKQEGDKDKIVFRYKALKKGQSALRIQIASGMPRMLFPGETDTRRIWKFSAVVEVVE